MIEIKTGLHCEAEASLSYKRFYLAQRADNRWMKVDWDSKPEERLSLAHKFDVYFDWSYKPVTIPMHLFSKKSEDRPYHLLLYTDKLWNGLELLKEKLERLAIRIDELLDSEEGRARIEQHAQRLLPK